MLTTQVRDIATLNEGILLHGTNCIGAFGSGVAGVIARTWPSVRNDYMSYVNSMRADGKTSADLLGDVQWTFPADKFVIGNCFTQESCGADGQRYASPDAVRKALTEAFNHLDAWLIAEPNVPDGERTVYMPQIGCGLGGLSWTDEVEPIVKELYLDKPRLFHLIIVTL